MAPSRTISGSIAKPDAENGLERIGRGEAPPTVRILLIAADLNLMRAVESSLPRLDGDECHIDRSASVEEACDRLAATHVDAIVLDLDLQGGDRLATFEAVRQTAGEIPIVVLAGSSSMEDGEETVRRGAVRCLARTDFDFGDLVDALRMDCPPPDQQETPGERPGFDAASPSETTGFPQLRRSESRISLCHRAVVIPIAPEGAPHGDEQVDAVTVEISRAGISVETDHALAESFERAAIGVEESDGSFRYAVGTIKSVRHGKATVQYGVAFSGPSGNVLRDENLTPCFDVETMRFAPPLDALSVQQWVDLGVAIPEVVDTVDVCPQCESVASFRTGCRQCGSARPMRSELLHHFACAHVAAAADFEGAGGPLSCPKCRETGLRVGADTEYIAGPWKCGDCGSCDWQTERVRLCLRCRYRFPVHEALTTELVKYHVHRLDPLAFLPASGRAAGAVSPYPAV